jgi:hypothetical protein
MRPSLSWDLTWPTLIACYRHFGTSRLSHLQMSSIRWRILPWQTAGPILEVQTVQEELFSDWFTLKTETTDFPEVSVTNYYIAPYNIPEERRLQPRHLGRGPKSETKYTCKGIVRGKVPEDVTAGNGKCRILPLKFQRHLQQSKNKYQKYCWDGRPTVSRTAELISTHPTFITYFFLKFYRNGASPWLLIFQRDFPTVTEHADFF